MHPGDAAQRGLSDGDEAQISSAVGSLTVPIELFEGLMPGVVSLPHGFGHRYAGTRQSIAKENHAGVSANDLVDESALDIPSGTSVVNGVPVEVSALSV